jgi:septal ring factor EnvC (AmiA/AmiB activator)
MARTKTSGSIDSEIQKVRQSIIRAKARYDELAESLRSLEKQKRSLEAKKIMDAFEKSGKTHKELMTFLNA